MIHSFASQTFFFIIIIAFLLFQKRRIDEENAAIEQLKNELNGESK